MSTLTPPTPATTPTRNRLWTQITRFGLFNWIIVLCGIAAGSVGAVSCLGRSEAPPIVETSIVNNAYYAAAASTAQATVQAINVARGTVYRALSGQPEPAVGLYWTSNADPTAGGGVCGAPLWQLLWRTDVPSVYFKSGAACTAWTRVGNGASPGTGTVTSITCGTGEACTPANPITTSGTVTLNINGGVTQTCGAGTAVTALTGVGLTTCTAVGSGTVGPGTTNRVAKFTGATTVGDTQFPIDDGATALTLGDNTTSDITTMDGRLSLVSTLTNNHAEEVSWTPSASTANNLAALRSSTAGTFDATAGALSAYGLYITISSTRSAGANSLTNVAERLDASGAQTNIALHTANGANYLNGSSGSTGIGYSVGATLPDKLSVTGGETVTGNANLDTVSGVTAIGFSTATANALTIKGQSTQTSVLSTGNAASITWTPVGGTTTNLAALNLTSNGTIDTTAGALTARGLMVINTTARSAGANNLTNVAGAFTSTGAQVNVALRTIDGSNYFNDTSGNTGVGYAIGATIPQKFAVNGTSEIVGVLTLDATLVGATAQSGEVVGNAAASTTVPTLIPNIGSTSTGVGGASGTVSIIAGGVEKFRCNSTGCFGISTTNRGTITLSGGTGTATTFSGAICTCTDTTANASVKCAVSTTTLTATGTGTDVIAYICT